MAASSSIEIASIDPNLKTSIPNDQEVETNNVSIQEEEPFDYSQRAQWLRAAILGANDGLVSTASLMMGVGAIKQDIKVMILTGFAGLVAGACSMAIGEFVSVYSQRDIHLAQIKREKNHRTVLEQDQEQHAILGDEKAAENLPNPLHAAIASALAFSVGAVVPLLAASFIKEYNLRVGVVVASVTAALILFGWAGAALGRAPWVRAVVRVTFGGWAAMGITFGFTKLVGSKAVLG